MDTFADHVWNPNKVFRPSRTSIETHTIDFEPDMAGSGLAYLQDIEADFNVERDCGDVRAELVLFKFGSLPVTRDMLCEILSRAEVEAIEQGVATRIMEARS